MTLQDLQDDVRTKTLHHRSLIELITTDKFERLWEASSPEDRDKITALVEFGYRSKVREWVKNHESLELGERSIAFLRQQGRELSIKNYSRLTKSELIFEIMEKTK